MMTNKRPSFTHELMIMMSQDVILATHVMKSTKTEAIITDILISMMCLVILEVVTHTPSNFNDRQIPQPVIW